MIPALLGAIAVVAYLLGCINATAVMQRILRRPRAQYRRLGYGAEGLLRIWRAYGWWGLGITLAVDLIKKQQKTAAQALPVPPLNLYRDQKTNLVMEIS